MLENFLFHLLGVIVGIIITTAFFVVKYVLPYERLKRKQLKQEREAREVLALLLQVKSKTFRSRTQTKNGWRTDEHGNIISPLQEGRDGS